jgi:hypothetical protein
MASDEKLNIHTKSAGDVVLAVGGGDVGIGDATPSYKLDVAGDIQCVALHETSDARLKTDIEPLTDALAKVQQVRGVTFAWNETAESFGADVGDQQIGLIAQELETVFPELVATADNGYKSVDYTKLTPVLIEAIKELKNENDGKTERIDQLEAQMAEMQSLLQRLSAEKH